MFVSMQKFCGKQERKKKVTWDNNNSQQPALAAMWFQDMDDLLCAAHLQPKLEGVNPFDMDIPVSKTMFSHTGPH